VSTEYYLVCERCKELVWLTDNKANPFPDQELVKRFLGQHGCCKPVLKSEYMLTDNERLEYRNRFADQFIIENVTDWINGDSDL